jgi:hypothetical protein
MNIKLTGIKNLIQQGELQNAISEITEITNEYSSRYHNEIILHAASLKQIIEDERKDTFSIQEIRREKKRIVYAILDLINEIEQEIILKDREHKNINKPNVKDKKIKILFLAANPSGTTRLKLAQESSSIDRALRQSEFRDKFEVIQHWGISINKLQEILLRYQPDVIHFSGHGSETSELIFEDNTGNIYPVSVRALSQLFYILKDNIRCVVLNACYSQLQAQTIAQYIDGVVGMSIAITDKAAISFATAFYQALGYGRNLKTAFDLGCVQIDMENLNEQDTPKLLALKSDPREIFLTNNIEF